MSEADKIFEIAIRRRTLRVALASSKASIYSLQWSGDVQYCTDSIRGDWSRWRILETRISYDYAGAHWLKVGGLPTRSFRWWANKSKTWKLCIKDCSGGGEGPWWSVRWVRMCGRNCHLEKIFQERRSIPDCVSISYRSQNRVFFFGLELWLNVELLTVRACFAFYILLLVELETGVKWKKKVLLHGVWILTPSTYTITEPLIRYGFLYHVSKTNM